MIRVLLGKGRREGRRDEKKAEVQWSTRFEHDTHKLTHGMLSLSTHVEFKAMSGG